MLIVGDVLHCYAYCSRCDTEHVVYPLTNQAQQLQDLYCFCDTAGKMVFIRDLNSGGRLGDGWIRRTFRSMKRLFKRASKT